MNTKDASTDIARLKVRDDDSKAATASAPLVASTAYLQGQLTQEQDGRKDERFMWSFVVMMLLNVIIMPGLGRGLIALFVLFEFIFLFVFGRMCGVDYIYKETQNAIDTFDRFRGRKNPVEKD